MTQSHSKASPFILAVAFLAVPLSETARADEKPRTYNVLLVNGRPAKEDLDRSTGFLRVALNPFGDKPAPQGDQVRPRVQPASDFAGLSENDLAAYDCVYFCDVPRLTTVEVERLKAFVRKGGGVVFYLGPQVDLESYNKHLYADGKSLLPVKLLKIDSAPDKKRLRFHIPEDARRQLPLKMFGDREAEALMQPAIVKCVLVGKPAREENVETVLSFVVVSDEEPNKTTPVGPAVLAWRPTLGGEKPVAGRVILVTTTANTEWTNWPTTVSFVIFQHELMRFAARELPRR